MKPTYEELESQCDELRIAIVQLRDAARELLKALGNYDWQCEAGPTDPGYLDLQLAIDSLQEVDERINGGES